ncbi:MAG TPA: amino acid adenylation domain-containing protein, partial [Hymenobacter sp.]|nr:amino acid adenylation domain-containing protein [Hymenobacter sp.]
LGVTPFTLLLSAFKVFLFKYSGQLDVCVGTPVANRDQAEFNSLIGFFLNTLVIRTDLSGNPAFETLVARVRDTMIEAHQHQDTPFEKVVEAVVTQRDRSRSPLFQVLFVMQDRPDVSEIRLGDASLSPVPFDNKTTKYDLTFTVVQTPDGLTLSLEYATDLFSPATIHRMLRQYEELLKSIVEQPECEIGRLSLLTWEEERTLLEAFNATELPYPREKTLADLFEAQARQAPQAIALLYEEESLTYGALFAQACQLAQYLLKSGLQPGDLVGIGMGRSPEMVIALWGVMLSGGVYVPMDPDYPRDRIKFTMQDAGVRVVITERKYAPLFTGRAEVALLFADEHPYAAEPAERPIVQSDEAARAYIIYTSGSTGKPKGVAITQENVRAFLYWCYQEFADTPADTVYAATSICFDLSVFEIFYSLTAGKQVRLLGSALAIAQWLPQDRNVLLNTVPSVVNHLLANGTDLRKVVAINMAGEPIPPAIIQQLDLEITEVRNLYGPSEDTTYSTCYRFAQAGPVLIGKPIGNTQVYLLDEYAQLAPLGVAGELCLGGAGVAMGYLNRVELTAERFVVNPLPGGKGFWYKTGDLARWLPDGNLVYLGRKDDQVKVRGYRIELGEVEHVLAYDPQVIESVVTVKEDAGGNRQLIAYVAVEDAFDEAQTRKILQTHLPAYMVPTVLIALNQLPRTPNGKIDKKALPDPQDQAGTHGYVEPRNEVEHQLAQIWQQLLALDRVGIYDDFFQLGGHSLLANQVVAAVKNELAINLSLKDVFERTRIVDLSELIQAAGV